MSASSRQVVGSVRRWRVPGNVDGTGQVSSRAGPSTVIRPRRALANTMAVIAANATITTVPVPDATTNNAVRTPTPSAGALSPSETDDDHAQASARTPSAVRLRSWRRAISAVTTSAAPNTPNVTCWYAGNINRPFNPS